MIKELFDNEKIIINIWYNNYINNKIIFIILIVFKLISIKYSLLNLNKKYNKYIYF